MKRNDLIKELAIEMQNWMTAPSSDNDYLSEANLVLNFIESKGMLPPKSKYGVELYAKSFYDEDLHTWEPEE